MKMRNLLFGVILGLLAVVHSTPVNIVTQIPTKAEDDVFREAMTDGFLIDHFLLPSLTTESPKRNTTVSQQSSSDSQWSDIIEGSAEGETSVKSMTSVFLQRGGEHYATTTQSVSHAQSSTSAVLPRDAEDTSSDSSATQSPQSSFTSSSVPNEAQSSVTLDHILVSQTTDPAVSSFDFLSTPSSDLGSDGEMIGQSTSTSSSMTFSSNTETSAASSTSTAAPQMFAGSEGSGSGSESGSGMSEEIPVTTVFAGSEGPGSGSESGLGMSEKIPVTTVFAGSEGPGSGSESGLGMSEKIPVTTVFAGSEGPGSGSESGLGMSEEIPVTTVFAGSEGPGSGSESGLGMSEERVERVSTVFVGHEGPGSESESGSGISKEIPATEKKSRLMTYLFTNGQKEKEPENPPSAQNKGHSTPGWIIILGFIVGVAALVMLCVAIATRDKWNGPNQASQLETKTNSSNQQRELEMETFLHKDNPRENGKAAEYTVIPLDELPEKYFSH